MSHSQPYRIASAAYAISQHASFAAYAEKLRTWVWEARECDLLVFPEYASLELASIGMGERIEDLRDAFERAAAYHAQVRELFYALAQEVDAHILAPTTPAFEGDAVVNRAVLYGPSGVVGTQDKQVVTPTDRRAWGLTDAKAALMIHETAQATVGILICYDSEFPLLGRRLAEQGASLLLVPSYTQTVSGYHRVRIAAMARALENQCVVVHAPTVGHAPWFPAMAHGYGAAAIYAPPDGFWPESGVVVQGQMNQVGWVKATIDLERIALGREEGEVHTFHDWARSMVVRQPDAGSHKKSRK